MVFKFSNFSLMGCRHWFSTRLRWNILGKIIFIWVTCQLSRRLLNICSHLLTVFSKVDLRFPTFFVEPPIWEKAKFLLRHSNMFCLFIEIYLNVQQLRPFWNTTVECWKWFWINLQQVLFLPYVFNLTEGKMANASSHQRTILKVKKPTVVLS